MEGLLGNWDEDEKNDLKRPDGGYQRDMSAEAIYRDFGLACKDSSSRVQPV